MNNKDLFVVIYGFFWAVLITVLGVYMVPDKCEKATYIIISNMSFLIITSILVFVRPVRRWVYRKIISKL